MIRHDAIFIFGDSTLHPHRVICLFATFVAEPRGIPLTLLLASPAHWFLGDCSTATAGRVAACLTAVMLVLPTCAVAEALPRLRLLVLAALRGCDFLLAFSLSTVSERSLIIERLGLSPSVRLGVYQLVRPSARLCLSVRL